MPLISRDQLLKLYVQQRMSSAEIAKDLGCSTSAVNYWLKRYRISKRSISEAVYVRQNPEGDPFKIIAPKTVTDGMLYGMGLGLYWGEGTKSNKTSVRLGNTDPRLIKTFISFLENCYNINKADLKYGLQIFSDTPPAAALAFWQKELKAKPSQFQQVVVTPSRGNGTYKRKIPHGVLTVYYFNKKLRDVLNKELENSHGI